MKRVSAEELARMDAESDRCARELSDARCDVMAYACLVAIMAAGAGYHSVASARLSETCRLNGGAAPVVTSAGALVDGVLALGARRVALIAPYMKPLTALVVAYLEAAGIDVVDAVSLEVPDNLAVGRLDPMALPEIASRLDLKRADALVLSACVQMPSFPAIGVAEDRFGLPVLSAATATTRSLLRRWGCWRCSRARGRCWPARRWRRLLAIAPRRCSLGDATSTLWRRICRSAEGGAPLARGDVSEDATRERKRVRGLRWLQGLRAGGLDRLAGCWEWD